MHVMLYITPLGLTHDYFVILFADLFWNTSHEYNLVPDMSRRGINGLVSASMESSPQSPVLRRALSPRIISRHSVYVTPISSSQKSF